MAGKTMPSKQFDLDGGLAVTVYKRRSSRHLRLSISPAGQVRVSIPAWAPYRSGVEFAQSRAQWIRAQQQPALTLIHGQAVGKSHHLCFAAAASASKPTSRVTALEVVIRHPAGTDPASPAVQHVAERACWRALRRQAEQLLPQRLEALALEHDFAYRSVAIKRLQSRWGSCDQHGRIVLNAFLMQLPWELIDYVLLHELMHTRLLKHGPVFWRAMDKVLPDTAEKRKRLRAHRPVLSGVGSAG